jgi:hypothetical protein
MKNKIQLLLLLTLISSAVISQPPQQFAYQAVVRDNSNQVVVNRTVGMRISIIRDSLGGQSAYTETHTPKTNQQGIVQLNIGAGTVVAGTFASVPWSSRKLFVKTELDLQGGSNYSMTGTTQLLSVPYSMYASDLPVSKIGDTVTIGKSRLIIPGSQLLPGAAPASLSDGLVAYYPFNGNADDESGKGNHGTVNGATLTTDRFGLSNKSYSFNINNWISIQENASLNPSGSISISLWVLSSQNHGNAGIIGKWNNFGGSKQYGKEQYVMLATNNSLGGVSFYINTSSSSAVVSEKVSPIYNNGKWHNYIGIWNGNELKLYQDGLLVSSYLIGGTLKSFSQGLEIGRYSGASEGSINYFIGKIDDVRIYNRALTQDEISYLANY